jgi:hypothetical protein
MSHSKEAPRCSRATAFAAISLAAIFVLMIVPALALGQPTAATGDDSPKIDAKGQAEIIDSVSAALNEVYVFPDVAKKMEQYLRKRYKEKAYKDLTTTREFTSQLTEDVREISKDLHLRVSFVPQQDADFFRDRADMSEEEAERITRLIEEVEHENPIRVPVTAIYTKRDGIVDWRACVDRHSLEVEHVEVASTHLGLGIDPDVWHVIADRLAA